MSHVGFPLHGLSCHGPQGLRAGLACVASFPRSQLVASETPSIAVLKTLSQILPIQKVCIFFTTLGLELEKAMAPHSSPLAWRILWTEEPGRLQSVGCKGLDMNEQLHVHFFSAVQRGSPVPFFYFHMS